MLKFIKKYADKELQKQNEQLLKLIEDLTESLNTANETNSALLNGFRSLQTEYNNGLADLKVVVGALLWQFDKEETEISYDLISLINYKNILIEMQDENVLVKGNKKDA